MESEAKQAGVVPCVPARDIYPAATVHADVAEEFSVSSKSIPICRS